MDIVLVKWLDACGGELSSWRDIEVLKKTTPAICYSTGFLVHEGTKDDIEYLVVCPHMTYAKEGDGELAIPKSWVLKVSVLSSVTF